MVALTELTEGWFNAAYTLTLSDGRHCVLKVGPPPAVAVLTYEHDNMVTEVAALRLVRERTTLPVPRVLWSDTSCRRVPGALFVMEHCGGRLPSAVRPALSIEQQRTVDVQLAGFLRQANSITNPTFGLLYLFVIMVVEVAYRHYPTDDIEHFARNRLALTLAKFGIDAAA